MNSPNRRPGRLSNFKSPSEGVKKIGAQAAQAQGLKRLEAFKRERRIFSQQKQTPQKRFAFGVLGSLEIPTVSFKLQIRCQLFYFELDIEQMQCASCSMLICAKENNSLARCPCS